MLENIIETQHTLAATHFFLKKSTLSSRRTLTVLDVPPAMAQPGKVVSAQKQSARSNVEIARATKQARGLEVDAELLELRAKNARLTSDNSACSSSCRFDGAKYNPTEPNC